MIKNSESVGSGSGGVSLVIATTGVILWVYANIGWIVACTKAVIHGKDDNDDGDTNGE